MADLSRTVAIIFEGEDRVTVATDKIARTFTAVGSEATGAASKVDQLEKELGDVEKKAPGISGVGDALKALAASLVVKAFIDANVAVERFTQSMTATTGSAKLARLEYEYVSEVSNRLGIETRSTAEAYARFAASVQGTSLAGEGARKIFEAFAGTMSRVGSSSAEINGAFVQLSQGISKGKFELEDLKSIAERIPGFFDKFSTSLGVTTPALFDLISAGKIGSAEIEKFAESLNKSLSGAKFDSYEQQLARLKDAIDKSFQKVGEAGTFDLLTAGVKEAGDGVSGLSRAVGDANTLVRAFFNGEISLSELNAAFSSVEVQASTVSRIVEKGLNQSLAETERLARQAGNSAGTTLADGLGKAAVSADVLKKAGADLDKSLKALGIDPKTFVDPIKEMEDAFRSLSTNASATGDQIVTGLIGALQKLPQDASLDEFRRQIAYAFRDGKITAEQYAQALALIDTKQKGLSPSFGPVTEAARKQAEELNKTADAAKKAADEASKYQLEMEKLASNERIKNIEAKVSLNIAQLQEDTKRVEAAFDSINNTVNSTGDLIGDLFGLFKDFDNLSFGAIRAIEDQIELENKRRQEALDLQKKLVEAQIRQLQAQTRALEKGDSLIKIDGAGLQPHLEAFMWEILRTIQVRVNADGLGLLLGV